MHMTERNSDRKVPKEEREGGERDEWTETLQEMSPAVATFQTRWNNDAARKVTPSVTEH